MATLSNYAPANHSDLLTSFPWVRRFVNVWAQRMNDFVKNNFGSIIVAAIIAIGGGVGYIANSIPTLQANQEVLKLDVSSNTEEIKGIRARFAYTDIYKPFALALVTKKYDSILWNSEWAAGRSIIMGLEVLDVAGNLAQKYQISLSSEDQLKAAQKNINHLIESLRGGRSINPATFSQIENSAKLLKFPHLVPAKIDPENSFLVYDSFFKYDKALTAEGWMSVGQKKLTTPIDKWESLIKYVSISSS